MREAPVPLGRPLPGLGQGRDPSLNRSTCAHEAWNAACASVRVSKMMRACCACIKETARGLTARLPRTAEIGDSQKARLGAPEHAMMYSNECTCIKKHAKPCFGCMACACTCGMRHWRAMLPVRVVSTDTVFCEDRVDSLRSSVPAKRKQYMTMHAHGWIGGHRHAQMLRNKLMRKQTTMPRRKRIKHVRIILIYRVVSVPILEAYL